MGPTTQPAARWHPTPFLMGCAGWHAASAVALGLSPRQWPAVAGALIANHLVLTAASLWPQSRLLGPNLVRLPAAAAARSEVALTFDDGPDPEVTPRVLDLLARHSGPRGAARATFFCIGRRVEACPELADEIAHRGHRVENHSWSHPHAFSCYPPAALRREICRAQEAIARATGRPPELFRAPAGFRSLLLEPELLAAGLRLASWTRRGYDTLIAAPERVARRLLHNLAAGDVLLLHDGGGARDRHRRPVVLDALARVLDGLHARGFTPTAFEPPRGEVAEPLDRRT